MLTVTKSNFLLSRCPRFAMVQLRMGKGRASRHTTRHGLTFVAVELSRLPLGETWITMMLCLTSFFMPGREKSLRLATSPRTYIQLGCLVQLLIVEHIFCRWSVYKGLAAHDFILI